MQCQPRWPLLKKKNQANYVVAHHQTNIFAGGKKEEEIHKGTRKREQTNKKERGKQDGTTKTKKNRAQQPAQNN